MRNYLIIGILTLLYSCSPMTKESYLEDYKQFIAEVSDENSNYSENDWKNADEKYNKFTGEWHKKFEDELVWKEQIVLTKYQVQYKLYRYKGNATEVLGEIFGNYNEVKKQVKYYSENNMDNDIQFLMKQANELGGTYTKMLEDIFVELDIDLNVKLKANNNRSNE